MSKYKEQVAALPVRLTDKKQKVRVLLITSRETKRWVVPKGWPMDGKKPWCAARIEALEEAGATGSIASKPLGSFTYDKILADGAAQPCRVMLYPLRVESLKRRWKEQDERERRWFSPKRAAEAVQEPDLKELLLGLDAAPEDWIP